MSLHPSLSRKPPVPSYEFCRVVCCNHEHLTLCGHIDDQDAVDDVDEDTPLCVVCAELEPTDFCPARETCPA